MTQSAEKFAQLLSESIHRIRQQENKTVSIVQDEMGYALGRKGGSAIERWRKGYLPPKMEDVQKLAEIMVERGRFEREWIEAFLGSAGYPQPEAFCDTLFGTAVIPPTLQPERAVSPPLAPAPQRVSPGLMASISMMVLVALLWLWVQSTAVPSSQVPLPLFPTNQYGILLLADPGDDTEALVANALQAELAATGLSDRVELRTYSTSEPSLTALRANSKADLVAQVQTTAVAVTIRYELNRPSPALQAIADALSAPIPVASSLAASEVIANRIAVLANAALGYDALHNGEHEACARRFSAVLAYTEMLATDFTRAEASHVAAAVCLEALGQADEARAHYEAAIATNPDFAQGHFGLGNYWYSQRDLTQAQGFYEQTAVLATTDPLATDEVTARAYAGLGNIALAQERLADALDAFTQAIAYDDTHPAYFLARAAAYRALGDDVAAETDLLVCLDLAQTAEPDPSAYLQQVAADCRAALDAIRATATFTPTATIAATASSTLTPSPTSTTTPTAVPLATPTPAVTAAQLSLPTLPPQPTTMPMPTTAVPPVEDTPTNIPQPPAIPTLKPPSATPTPTEKATAVATSTFTPTPNPPPHPTHPHLYTYTAAPHYPTITHAHTWHIHCYLYTPATNDLAHRHSAADDSADGHT